MAISLHKDRLARLESKPDQQFQRLTSKDTDRNILKSHLSKYESINELKRTMETSLENIKTKLSSKFNEFKDLVLLIKIEANRHS